jgi:hypothetical protein
VGPYLRVALLLRRLYILKRVDQRSYFKIKGGCMATLTRERVALLLKAGLDVNVGL